MLKSEELNLQQHSCENIKSDNVDVYLLLSFPNTPTLLEF
jgi:hypothetical protein